MEEETLGSELWLQRAEKELIKALKEFKKKIQSKYAIEKMILFGSRATKNYHKESDVDLIIVSKDYDGIKSFKRSHRLYDDWDIDLPVDFICYTPEEFEKLAKRITIVREAEKEGIEI